MTLNELLEVLKEHKKLCVVLPLVFALAIFIAGRIVPDSYVANSSIYVLLQSNGDNRSNQQDLSASQMAANDVATMMQSEQVAEEVADKCGMESLKGYKVSVESSATSRVIKVSVKGPSEQGVGEVINQLIKVTDQTAKYSMAISGVRTMGRPLVGVAPNILKSAKGIVLGAVGGFFIAVVVAVIKETLNVTIRSKEEAEELLGLPVVGQIPSAGGR